MNSNDIAKRLTEAVTFYRGCGYRLVEVPWLVGKEAYMATKPSHVPDSDGCYVPAFDRYLIASGEQGFLERMLDGATYEAAVCVTPCFRVEPTYDDLHLPYFQKVELIRECTWNSAQTTLDQVIRDAYRFFSLYLGARVNLVETGYACGYPMYDIMTETGIELGSYGVRRYYKNEFDIWWVYGTGLAEPRFSLATEIK